MPLRLCLFGASDDTGNLGVSALLGGTLAGIAECHPDAELTVFDHGTGEAEVVTRLGEHAVGYRRVGAPWTRRIHRPSSFARLSVGAASGSPLHAGVAAVRAADAVLVLAGGDSFADLYGVPRLRASMAPMRLALRAGRPLVLLPQTYGPFSGSATRQSASVLVGRSSMAWARDRVAHAALVELAGADHDPERHRLGVDVAHLLPPASAQDVERWYGPPLDGGEQIALNVSGLIANPGSGLAGARSADARAALETLGRHVLSTDPSARIVLVPHVIGASAESDEPACRALADVLGPRAAVAPAVSDPTIAKALIARSSWMCGARMHATIAALSSGVPAAALAYSDKFAGTFGDLGRGAHVADARHRDAAALAGVLIASYEQRHDDRPAVRRAASHAQVRAQGQMAEILEAVAPRPLVGV